MPLRFLGDFLMIMIIYFYTGDLNECRKILKTFSSLNKLANKLETLSGYFPF